MIMQKLSSAISNPPNCRENLASLDDKADERRRHIKKDPKLFSQTLFFNLFIMLIFVQGLDTFLNAWAWQVYSVDHFKRMKRSLKSQQTATKSFTL